MRKLHRFIAVIGAVFAATIVFTGAAQARPVNAIAAPHVVKVTVPMRIVGFDAAVARAHGYVILTDSSGREYSVKAGGVTPNNRVYGNCGSSYLWEIAVGYHAVDVQTGFTIYNWEFPAVAYWWKYWMHDLGGTSSHTFGGGLAFRYSWADDSRWGALTPGPANAWVDSGSDAILSDGSVCTTAGPGDSTTIY